MQTVVHFDTQLLNGLAGTIIPLLVAVATKRLASGKTKSLVMLGLSVLSSAVTVALGEPEHGWPLYDYLFSVGQTVLAAGVSYNNVWKQLGTTDAIATSTASVGIGAGRAQ
jgi:hypothetical protein